MKEEIFVVDSNDKALAIRARDVALGEALWRRASGGVAIDPFLGLVLCHRRSLTKDERPGLWVATFGGKNHPSEAASTAAKRELAEEFGVKGSAIWIKFHRRIRSDTRRQFEYVFYIFLNSSQTSISIDPSEVSEYEWVPVSEVVSKLSQSNTSWYVYGYEIEMLMNFKFVWQAVRENKGCECTVN